MDIETMREAIKKPYSKSPTWIYKVDRMPDKQVLAIYVKFLHEDRLEGQTFFVDNRKKLIDDGVQLEMNI